MRINNNLMAMNTHRQLGVVTDSGAKATEKLSSGFRINRAGDDAAGLAISEKMRGQIRGLNMASKNAQDGISLIQTAEGALQETHAILQRMRELAVQSSTDTNTDEDRAEIQKEIDQLATEITRIANTTEFNTQNLLGGKFEAKFHVGANEGQNVKLEINNMTAKALGVESAGKFVGKGEDDLAAITSVVSTNPDVKELIFVKNGDDTNKDGLEVGLKDGKLTITAGEDVTIAQINDELEKYEVVLGADDTGVALDAAGKIKLEAWTETIGEIDDAIVNVADDTISELVFKANNSDDTIEVSKDKDGKVEVTVGQKATLDELNAVLKDYGISIESNEKDGDTEIGTIGSDVEIDLDAVSSPIKVNTQETADRAITTINKAIESVSAERSKLGAMQNRLEHTIKNLDTSAENLQASESRIRDVDMAKEMMEFTKQNILQQASTAMLAQANAAPQSVLQLLQ